MGTSTLSHRENSTIQDCDVKDHFFWTSVSVSKGSGKKKKRTDKYANVKSSGYGSKSASKSSPSKGKKACPPTELLRDKQKSAGDAALRDSQLSVSAIAAYVYDHMQGKDGVNNKVQDHYSQVLLLMSLTFICD